MNWTNNLANHEVMKKIIAAAERGKADGAKPKAAGGETRKAIKIGNSDTAEDIRADVRAKGLK